MANIKQVTVSGTTYDIEALHFVASENLNTPAQWKSYIDSLVGEGLKIVIDTKHASKEEPATTASASTMGKLYMVTLTGQVSGTYTEFVTIESGTTTKTYSWERIGTTEADLANYVKKATYTTLGPDTDATGSADLGTAVGTATITYKKSATATESTGSTATANTSEQAAQSVSFSTKSFAGTAATLSVSTDYTPAGTVSGHSHSVTAAGKISVGTGTANYTPGGSVSVTTSSGTTGDSESLSHKHSVTASGSISVATSTTGNYTPAGTVSGHSHSIGSSTTTVVTGYPNFSGGSASGTFVTGVKTDGGASLAGGKYGLTGARSNVMYAPTVTNGVLSWSTETASVVTISHTDPTFNTGSVSWTAASLGTASTATVVSSVNANTGNTTPTFTGTKVQVSFTGSAVNTDSKLGTHNHSYTKPTGSGTFTGTGAELVFTGSAVNSENTTPTFTGTAATITSTGSYTPQGTLNIAGSVAKHSHTYVNLPAHTHSITLTDTEITGEVEVAIGAHTHSLSGHTHNVNLA